MLNTDSENRGVAGLTAGRRDGAGQLELGGVYVPDDDEDDAELAAHHVDRKLQTRLTAEGLQKRLLTLYRDARGVEEEQGVSVLFLALGFLRWYESESSDVERFAPLVLLPVDPERDNARGRFRLAFRDQDLEPDLSRGSATSTAARWPSASARRPDGWEPCGVRWPGRPRRSASTGTAASRP